MRRLLEVFEEKLTCFFLLTGTCFCSCDEVEAFVSLWGVDVLFSGVGAGRDTVEGAYSLASMMLGSKETTFLRLT